MAVHQLTPGRSGFIGVENAVGMGVPLLLRVMDFKTGKTVLSRQAAQLQKGGRGDMPGRK
jgi:hypothetical protein